jgi:hypothetical protein
VDDHAVGHDVRAFLDDELESGMEVASLILGCEKPELRSCGGTGGMDSTPMYS